MIIFLLVLIILVIYYLSYFIYSNRNVITINRLLKDREIVPIASKPALLDKPLNEFYISTSHNSYLAFLQHLSFVKSQNIKNVLDFGSRVIELDISHINNIPIIAHGTKDFITTSYIYLEKALDTILQYGFNTSDPLIIFCEIYNTENEIVIQNIKQIFLNKFKDKLLLPNGDIGNYIANKPIKFFLNKVILLGTLDNFNILQDLLFPTNNFINYTDDDTRISQLYEGTQLSRIYKTSGLFSYLSFNCDFLPLWKNNYKLVTMNFQMKDSLLYEYLKFFKNTSFIHQSEINI